MSILFNNYRKFPSLFNENYLTWSSDTIYNSSSYKIVLSAYGETTIYSSQKPHPQNNYGISNPYQFLKSGAVFTKDFDCNKSVDAGADFKIFQLFVSGMTGTTIIDSQQSDIITAHNHIMRDSSYKVTNYIMTGTSSNVVETCYQGAAQSPVVETAATFSQVISNVSVGHSVSVNVICSGISTGSISLNAFGNINYLNPGLNTFLVTAASNTLTFTGALCDGYIYGVTGYNLTNSQILNITNGNFPSNVNDWTNPRKWQWLCVQSGYTNVDTTNTREFLTNQKSNKIKIGDNATLSLLNGTLAYLPNNQSIASGLVVFSNNYIDNTMYMFMVDLEPEMINPVQLSAITPYNYGKLIIPSGPKNINAAARKYLILSGTASPLAATYVNFAPSSASTPYITSNTDNYQVWAYYGTHNLAISAVTTSETIVYDMSSCDRMGLDYYRLAWFNPLGGWDYYNFTKIAVEIDEIERKHYLKNNNAFINGLYYMYPDARGTDLYGLSAVKRYQVSTDWLTDDEALRIEELFLSPQVYWINSPTEPNYDIPVIITNKNIEIKKIQYGKLFQYIIEFQMSNDIPTQI